MSGPLKFATLALMGLASGIGLFRCAAADNTSPTGLSPKAAQAAVEAETTAEMETPPDETARISHFVDISGCWRPVIGTDSNFSNGAAFTIFTIDSNTFIFNKRARTSFVVRPDLRFTEGNRDPEKPFFPPGYIHSTGTVSADGNTISRRLEGQSGSVTYRRCAQVIQAPPGTRDPVTAPTPSSTPEPEETRAPLSEPLQPGPAPAENTAESES